VICHKKNNKKRKTNHFILITYHLQPTTYYLQLMQQTAIIQKEQITRKAEIKYFQIPLPGTVKKIIAVEASVFCFSATANEPTTNNGNQGTTDPAPSTNNTGGNTCPNPGIASIDVVSNTDTGVNGIRTQVFRIGAAVNPGFVYSCGVYSVVVSIVAADGDTTATVAAKLAAEVNNTSLVTWSQYGSNNHNYKPTANSVDDLLTLTVDYQHSFFASGTGECQAAPPVDPPPSLLQYDPLFLIKRNEKAGTIALQSPDATDIFLQTDVFREDRNINFADFLFSGSMNGEWLKGRKRYATEILIRTESPILEAYYKDCLGEFHNMDLNYELNIIIWFEKQQS
jgi:hypothetical protein